jgi:hypothetical protein
VQTIFTITLLHSCTSCLASCSLLPWHSVPIDSFWKKQQCSNLHHVRVQAGNQRSVSQGTIPTETEDTSRLHLGRPPLTARIGTVWSDTRKLDTGSNMSRKGECARRNHEYYVISHRWYLHNQINRNAVDVGIARASDWEHHECT